MRRGGRELNKVIHYYEPYIDGKYHKVGISMESKDGQKVQFYTKSFKDDQKRGGDRFDTLAELYDWIDIKVSTLPNVTWEKVILIEVDGQSEAVLEATGNHRGESLLTSKIEVQALAFELGTDPDGKRYSRNPDQPKHVAKFEKNIGYGIEARWSWRPNDEDPYSRALIPDTEANRKLLVVFAAKFDQLRDQFFKAFAPENVATFLSRTSGLLLPLPESDEK